MDTHTDTAQNYALYTHLNPCREGKRRGLGLDIESRFIKEYLYTLHDWIVEVYSIGKEFKSNTYIMKENLEESRRKMKEIAERMAEVE